MLQAKPLPAASRVGTPAPRMASLPQAGAHAVAQQPSCQRQHISRIVRASAASSIAGWRQVAPGSSSALPVQRSRSRVAARAAASPGASTVTNLRHRLPDGLSLEVLHQAAVPGSAPRPPLVFIHGSYHAAWCWAEQFLPYFAAAGYNCYALSLRAQGGSDMIKGATAGAQSKRLLPILECNAPVSIVSTVLYVADEPLLTLCGASGPPNVYAQMPNDMHCSK